MTGLVVSTDRGLYCPVGDFYIDPWQPVDRAVVTHAHADHARPGCRSYLCSRRGVNILRRRVQPEAEIETVDWAERRVINGVSVSLHPAGHLLGSAQVRLEHLGEVWVISGDYKIEPDPTCDPFEPLRCDTFITESTFGLPIYRWSPQPEVTSAINSWWRDNVARGVTSIVFAWSLGKAQRVVHHLDPGIGPIVVHGSVAPFVQAYAEAGVPMPPVVRVSEQHGGAAAVKALKGKALVVAPPSVMDTPWLRKFAPMATSMASGWMRVRGRRRQRSLDRGFALSDHADWPGLLWAIKQTGASRIGVTHGYTNPLCHYLNEIGFDAFTIHTEYEGDEETALTTENTEGTEKTEETPE